MPFSSEPYNAKESSTLLICTACGTQFPTTDRTVLTTCPICDDPRQFLPPTGQAFTTLAELSRSHSNTFTPYEGDERMVSIYTTPKFGIGQRAILLKTETGNVLWDCISLLDEETVRRVEEMGGLRAIVISHPHYYSTHVQWARAFKCPVYISAEDRSWTTTSSSHQHLLTSTTTSILDTGVQAIKLGGHFPGSLVLLFHHRLLIADTLVTTPSGLGKATVDALGRERERPAGLNTFAFMWSIPNMIPLSAAEMRRMWKVLREVEFEATHGAFLGMDVEDCDVKGRVRESMMIQARAMGGDDGGFE
jgi:hypothetical protein